MPAPEVARRYAQALYEVSAAEGLTGRIAQDLSLIRALWNDHPDLVPPFLAHPLIAAQTKEAVLSQALDEVVHPYTLNLLRLLMRKGRAVLLPELAEGFFNAAEEQGKAVHVLVRMARPLSAAWLSTLKARLEEAVGRPVNLETVDAPELLAGVELKLAGRRIDASLRGRLARLAERLTKG